ncbi:MAG: MCP four helix bundle domain-containing protein [Deltaproteobacteria bacterium]|nr:MCP four helix bundle domain-containing protein [Deltaproteobacteria bacterium]
MFFKLSLRTRILIILLFIMIMAITGAVVTIWYIHQVDGSLKNIIDRSTKALNSAHEFDNALAMQKGYVSYFFLDGNPAWLDQLKKYQNLFDTKLAEANQFSEGEPEKKLLDTIRVEYQKYSDSKSKVITMYQRGEKEAGARLHQDVRGKFFEIQKSCEAYKELHQRIINEAIKKNYHKANIVNTFVLVTMSLMIFFTALLGYILLNFILEPIRQLTFDAHAAPAESHPSDEVKTLSRSVHTLIENADKTKIELELSHEILQKSEKWIEVGKLAAGVAHSVRNPLTSVKMRLFSMQRHKALTGDQKEDLDVISEEVRHIDSVINNFVEFARPPKLKQKKISPSSIVDSTLQLLHHRLKLYNVEVIINRKDKSPDIWADPDQLIEVLVNIITNACEAMVKEGRIEITEHLETNASIGRAVVISIADNGPGIPRAVQEKIFQPFFSTKDDGTGLGLSIAVRIINEHGGKIHVISENNKGTTFVISLPCEEK